MLDKLFLQILNMSFTASFVIALVLLVRLLLKKTPKIFSYALWSVVLFRLICPFSFESVFSVLPTKANPVPTNIGFMQTPQIDTGIPIINDSINPILPEATPVASINPLQIWMFLGEILWLSGIVALLIYSLVTLYKLIKKLKGAEHFRDNIYLSKNISTAFVLGVLCPKIYLPATLSEKEQQYILLHEETHIKRLDHIIKIVAFLVLCLHWFNPLVWVAFFAFSKDMEQACDEAVIKTLGNEVKKDYSASLLSLATGKRIVGGTPLAFGEGDTKGRVKNVLNYKKPAFWVIVVSVIAVALSVFCLVSNPQSKEPPTLYAYSENGVIPLNLGTYSWNGVEADSISYTEMEYKNAISYNENKGHHNANIFFSTSDTPSDFNTDNAKGTKDFKIVEMKRFVGGKEEVLDEFGGNIIEVSLEQDTSYLYVFKVQFGENHAYYSVKINNNVDENSEPFIKKVVNGAVSATTANNELSKEIVLNSMLISAAFEGIDIDSLDDYYHIRHTIGEDSTMEDYYVFLLDKKPVLQFGRGGRYVRLNDELYDKLESSFKPLTYDQAVIKALSTTNHQYLGEECFGEGHIILGTEKDGDATKIYTLTMVGNYGFVNNNFEKSSGSGIIPAVVTLKNNDVTIEYPKDGSDYALSIKEMFPLKYHSRIFGDNDGDRKDLTEQERSYAKEYLSKLGRKAEIGDYGDFEHTILTSLGVSVEVSNGLENFYKSHNYYPYFIGTKESIEDGIRMVYEMSYHENQKEIRFTKYLYDTRTVLEQFIFDANTGCSITISDGTPKAN